MTRGTFSREGVQLLGKNNWTGGAAGERTIWKTGEQKTRGLKNKSRKHLGHLEQLEDWVTSGEWEWWKLKCDLEILNRIWKSRTSRKHRLRMRRRGSYNVIAILAICPTMVRIFFGISVRPWRGNADISVHIFILYIKHRQYLFRIFACYDTLQYNVIMWYSSIWWLFLQSKNTQ